MGSRTVKTIPGARKSALPNFIAPQLATLVKKPPSCDEWLHELIFYGYRMLCRIDRGRVTVWSRNGKDWTEKFQNVIEAVKSLKLTNALHRVLESKNSRFDCPKLLEVRAPARPLHRRQAQRCRSGSRRLRTVAANNGC